MGCGILVCGLNGSGKSTLGSALARKLDFHFIDNEDLFFPKTDPHSVYAAPRSHEEAQEILMQEVKKHENFVFSAVKGDYGDDILPLYRYAVLMETPKFLRLQRVKNRSFQKFGARMLPGGDLYEQEKAFYDMVNSRTEKYVEDWISALHCPILRLDGTRPIEENITLILNRVQGLIPHLL